MIPRLLTAPGTVRVLWAALLLVLAACATRALSPAPDTVSPASPAAPAVPARPIAVMLEQDPPLPGADANWGAWPGLEPRAGAPGGHGAHGPARPGPDDSPAGGAAPDAGQTEPSGGGHAH